MPTVKLEIQIDSSGNVTGLGRIEDALDDVSAKANQTQQRMVALGRAQDKLATGAIATGGAMLYLAGQCVSVANDVEEMRGKFDVVFGENGAAAEAWAAKHADAVGRSKYDLMSYMSVLQDTFVPMGVARGDATELAESVTKLAVDLASFNNTAEPDTIRDLQSALVGNHETMRKYGVVITQATLHQELLKQGVEGGTKAASEQEKMMARLALIMAGTSDAQGDAARTSDSMANRMRSAQAAVKDLQVEVGEALVPVLEKIIPQVTEIVEQFAEFADTPAGQMAIQAAIGIAGLAVAAGTAHHGLKLVNETVEAWKLVSSAYSSGVKAAATAQELAAAGTTAHATAIITRLIPAMIAAAPYVLAIAAGLFAINYAMKGYEEMSRIGERHHRLADMTREYSAATGREIDEKVTLADRKEGAQQPRSTPEDYAAIRWFQKENQRALRAGTPQEKAWAAHIGAKMKTYERRATDEGVDVDLSKSPDEKSGGGSSSSDPATRDPQQVLDDLQQMADEGAAGGASAAVQPAAREARADSTSGTERTAAQLRKGAAKFDERARQARVVRVDARTGRRYIVDTPASQHYASEANTLRDQAKKLARADGQSASQASGSGSMTVRFEGDGELTDAIANVARVVARDEIYRSQRP